MTRWLSHCFSRTHVLLVGCLAMAGALSTITSAPAADEPRMTIVAIEGATTTYQSIDRDGKVVTVQVPSQSIADIRGADAQGTVQATVTAIDMTNNQVTMQTSAGQTIVLDVHFVNSMPVSLSLTDV